MQAHAQVLGRCDCGHMRPATDSLKDRLFPGLYARQAPSDEGALVWLTSGKLLGQQAIWHLRYTRTFKSTILKKSRAWRPTEGADTDEQDVHILELTDAAKDEDRPVCIDRRWHHVQATFDVLDVARWLIGMPELVPWLH